MSVLIFAERAVAEVPTQAQTLEPLVYLIAGGVLLVLIFSAVIILKNRK